MILAFTSDIHLPTYARDAFHMLTLPIPPIDVLLIAGDLTKRGVTNAFVEWFHRMKRIWKPSMVIAVWGNADKDPVRKKLPKLVKDIIFLEDQILEIGDITIIGTEGVIDLPTRWQLNHVPGIIDIYKNRIKWIANSVKSSKTKQVILLSHYGICETTIEDAIDKRGLTSIELCKVLKEHPPTLTTHGHSHHARVWKTKDPFPIYNVALPIHRRPILIDSKTLEEVPIGLFQ